MNIGALILSFRRQIIEFFQARQATIDSMAIEFLPRGAFEKSAFSSLLRCGVVKESQIKGRYYLDELKLAELYRREWLVIWITLGIFALIGIAITLIGVLAHILAKR